MSKRDTDEGGDEELIRGAYVVSAADLHLDMRRRTNGRGIALSNKPRWEQRGTPDLSEGIRCDILSPSGSKNTLAGIVVNISVCE